MALFFDTEPAFVSGAKPPSLIGETLPAHLGCAALERNARDAGSLAAFA
jgi:hypothetical protein